ncbi:MAG: hypothetical protein PVH87_17990 [Desulfobacteraceae bacterium]|jgi:hypothetical protein
MMQLGSESAHSREMDLDDIFISRLKLLIIMGNAFLKDAPLGVYRCKAMVENARHVESEAIDLGGLNTDHPNFTPSCGGMDFDHIFFQRVKLLAVMVKAVGKGHPMGSHRKMATRDNIDFICETIKFNNLQDIRPLKVA